MAAAAVTLVDYVCVQGRHERPRLCARALRCRSFTLHTRPLISVSALSDLQHVSAHLKTAPECHDHSENEEAVKVDSRKARRKGRTKKASALPPETQQNFSETNPGFSLVRSVINAEDSSNENRVGATSNDVSHQGKSGIGKITSQVNVDSTLKKKLAKRVAEPPLNVQTELLDNDTNDILVHTDKLTSAMNGMNIGSESSCQGNYDRTPLQHSSVSGGNKPRRRKSEHKVLEQVSHQSSLMTGFSDSITARRKASGAGHTAQELCKADDNRNTEYAAHTDECIEPMKLEYDADLGEVGFERSKYLDCLSSHSYSPPITEDLANEGSKLSGRKKQGRNVQLKQRISDMVDRMEGLGNPSMSEKHSDAGKITQALDKTALTNRSRNCEGGLPEQRLTAKVSSQKLSRYDMQVQQSDPEASEIGECSDSDKTADAERASKKFANGSHNSRKIVANLNSTAGPDFQCSLQKEGSRFFRSLKRSKRSRKQPEDIIADVGACKVSKHNQGMCFVRWFVETPLDENQKLFLVGENSYLGAWDPSMAVIFTRCEEVEQANLWQAHCQVPYGTHSEYNYFVQVGDDKETGPRIWRLGPKLFLAAPPENSQEREVIVKDLLDFNIANKLPALLWEGLQNEIGFPAELTRFLGDEIMLESLKQSKPVNSEINSSNSTLKQKEAPDVIEQKEEWKNVVLEDAIKEVTISRQIDDSVLLPNPESEDYLYSVKLTPKLRKLIRKRVFPREEPWLIESMILYEKGDMAKSPTASFVERGQEADTSQEAVVEKILGKEEVSTEILINSSKSTMERIAILENGKLVELLLKPVNSDINVGNVYLGIVKKLLPGMTGVFVDIGHPRVALLTITKNVYPFTFPPIGSNDKPSDSHVLDADGHLSGEHEVSSVELSQDLEKCDDPADEDWETEVEDDEEDETKVIDDGEELAGTGIHSDASHEGNPSEKPRGRKLLLVNEKITRPITVNFGQRFRKWRKVEEGMRIIVQVKREPLGKKGPKVCAFPQLSSRFWVLGIGGKSTGISKKILGPERRRLKDLANLYRKPGFELTVRTEAAGQSPEDLEKDLMRLLETWEDIIGQAEGASFAAQNGQDGAVPALLHRALGQTLSIVRDFFAEKVQRMVVDSAQTYQEVTSYLQEVAPQLQNRVELYTGTSPIFDVFNLEDDINRLFDERVQLPNGAYLVIEETEALVTIDVNGGAGMLGKNMKSAAILETNIAAASQIAAELRLRDIGGIIVIDFIDMDEDEHESLVYEEMRNAIQLDRSIIYISEISELGLMEVTRRRVRPSVTFMISDPCACCHGTGRVEALETTFSKIERAILRLVANHLENIHFDGRTWKKVLLRVDPVMFEFLTKKQRAAQLSSCLKVYIILKVGREMSRGSFELSELNLEGEKRFAATTGQQQRSLRKAVRLGAGGASKDLRP